MSDTQTPEPIRESFDEQYSSTQKPEPIRESFDDDQDGFGDDIPPCEICSPTNTKCVFIMKSARITPDSPTGFVIRCNDCRRKTKL